MVHDYQLYTLPAMVRRARPDVFLHHFVHIPWTQSDAWRVLPTRIRDEIYRGLLANDIVGFHTRSYRRNFLQCCRDLLDLEVDMERGVVHVDDREVWVRAYPLPIDYEATRAGGPAASACRVRGARSCGGGASTRSCASTARTCPRTSCAGSPRFDIFLEQHPEFAERITFTAQLMPSRTDVPEYAEYLEKIEALVAVVNHRHGTTDWMPIDLKLRDDLDEAVASYKHYDVMMVNAMFDGMNLVAKEGPLVNERDGVSILSENTGAHEELGEFALSVNPFDVQELADAIYSALTMSRGEPRAARAGAEGDRHLARSGRLDRRADRGHPREGAARPTVVGRRRVEPLARDAGLGLAGAGAPAAALAARAGGSTGVALRRRAGRRAQVWPCAALRRDVDRRAPPRRLTAAAVRGASSRPVSPPRRPAGSAARCSPARGPAGGASTSGLGRAPGHLRRGRREPRPGHHGDDQHDCAGGASPRSSSAPGAAGRESMQCLGRVGRSVRPALLACAAAWPQKPLSTT